MEKARLADPASRFQPDGPHGDSAVIDSQAFPWTVAGWPGIKLEGQIRYEMHVGTFTKEGTLRSAQEQLKELASAGITLIEIMPIADFPGRFGWGYDGVNFFAPTWLYGHPDDLRRFVDEAHAQKLGVILDVVYNHVGPGGNFLKSFSAEYFTSRYKTDWGEESTLMETTPRPFASSSSQTRCIGLTSSIWTGFAGCDPGHS